MIPRSTRPVTTVPRPEIENTSSIGIRKWLVNSTLWQWDVVSRAQPASTAVATHSVFAFKCFKSRTMNDRSVITWEVIQTRSSRTSISTSSSSSSVDQPCQHLFMKHDVWNTNLARQAGCAHESVA